MKKHFAQIERLFRRAEGGGQRLYELKIEVGKGVKSNIFW